jgi:protein TonB
LDKPLISSHRLSAAKLKNISAMSIAIWASVLIHVVILSLHFESDIKKFADRLPTLEVLLVNAKTQTKPEKADVLAQANLDRGGNTDQDRKMKTPLPAIKQQKAELTVKPTTEVKSGARAAKKAAEETQEEKRVTELEQKAQELLTQIKATKQVESESKQASTAKESETGDQETPSKLNSSDMIAQAIEIDRLEASIDKKYDEYQKKPKRKFIGARAKEYKYALYVDTWRQKVERVGNLNYPEAAKNLKLYGNLQLTVSIKSDGTLESVELTRSSGHKVLDDAAKQIVELAAPYARFPDDIRNEVDILSITRTWTFTKEDSLATQ